MPNFDFLSDLDKSKPANEPPIGPKPAEEPKVGDDPLAHALDEVGATPNEEITLDLLSESPAEPTTAENGTDPAGDLGAIESNIDAATGEAPPADAGLEQFRNESAEISLDDDLSPPSLTDEPATVDNEFLMPPESEATAETSDAEAAEASHDNAKAVGEIAALVGGLTAVGFTPPVEPPPPPTIVEEPLPPPPDAADPAYPAYQQLTTHVRQTSLLGSIEAVLNWDERCMMPAAATEQRAEQITLLSGLIHERLTDPRLGEWLTELSVSNLAADPQSESGATIRQIKHQYEKRSKLPKRLVEELAHTAVVGQHTWQEARKNNDFASFAPLLETMVRLKREQADALGFEETRYDALLDEFEQGERTSRVAAVLGALRDELVPLVAQVRDGGRVPDVELLQRQFPVELQRSFGRHAAERIGFDFQRGRLDVTAHPFCTGLGPNDCRITTRYDQEYFNAGFFGILHEAGHGIYDQGLRPDQYGLPLGEAVSMGIHESQSRMWEILVGRGLPFWKHFYGKARRTFGKALGGVSLGKFYFAVNDVRPSLIRVEADEFTYNLHILIRFELEQALISGDLQVADLPAAWNERYRNYLGLEVPNDADGVLQDIHWSAGLFGYFPTYSLGNLYAAQLYEQADQDLGGLDAQFERGEFQYLRKWLNVNIHRHGQRFTAAQLVERITGAPLSHEPLMRHLRKKYELLYDPAAASLDEVDVPDGEAAGDESPQAGGVAMADAGDVGGYGLSAEPGFDGFSVGGGTAAVDFAKSGGAVVAKKKKKASAMGGIIVLIGIVVGGGLGIGLGLWLVDLIKGDKDKPKASPPATAPAPEPSATPESEQPPANEGDAEAEANESASLWPSRFPQLQSTNSIPMEYDEAIGSKLGRLPRLRSRSSIEPT